MGLRPAFILLVVLSAWRCCSPSTSQEVCVKSSSNSGKQHSHSSRGSASDQASPSFVFPIPPHLSRPLQKIWRTRALHSNSGQPRTRKLPSSIRQQHLSKRSTI